MPRLTSNYFLDKSKNISLWNVGVFSIYRLSYIVTGPLYEVYDDDYGQSANVDMQYFLFISLLRLTYFCGVLIFIYCRSTFFHVFLPWLVDFLKSRIGIFTDEKPRLGLYGMKKYTEYSSFLNLGCYIFRGLDANRENLENMVTAEKWRSTVIYHSLTIFSYTCLYGASKYPYIWRLYVLENRFIFVK